jgi:hypothetical protein
MKILFLDIDGVLNRALVGALRVEPECVANLNALLARVPSAVIVISSTWRQAWPLPTIALDLAAAGFAHSHAIIGATPVRYDRPRAEEIKLWLAQVPRVERFAIVDDYGDAEIMDHFVRTDPKVGLTAADVERVVEILNG